MAKFWYACTTTEGPENISSKGVPMSENKPSAPGPYIPVNILWELPGPLGQAPWRGVAQQREAFARQSLGIHSLDSPHTS